MAEVFVWWAHVGDLTDSHLTGLDDHERQRWSRLQRAGDRDRFALGAALLRGLVAELDGTAPGEVMLDRACGRCGAQHGPVTTPGRAWQCSVSHSGSFALAAGVSAAAPRLIGVDLEAGCPSDWVELLPQVLAADEAAPTGEADFVTLWVRKEAVLKATGAGLTQPMTTVTLREAGRVAQVVGRPRPVHLVDLDLSQLRAAGIGDTAAAALAVDAEPAIVHWQRGAI